MHIRLSKHQWSKERAHLTEKKDIKRDKLDAQHIKMPHVYWGDLQVTNDWQSLYLGSIFQPDGDELPDIRARCAMAKTRAGSLRHVWAAKALSIDLKIRIYITTCCSILVYGSEAWRLSAQACKIINGANAFMLSHITKKSKREEATKETTTFNILAWIRSRRLKWVGHILRLSDDRLVKQTLRVIHDNPQDGDILMDVHDQTWEQLINAAKDREEWRRSVWQLKQMAQRSTKPAEIKKRKQQHTRCKTTRSRFTFYPTKSQKEEAEEALGNQNPFSKAKRQLKFVMTKDNATYSFAPTAKATAAPSKKVNKKPKKKLSNDKARTGYYSKLTAKAAEEEHFHNLFATTARTTTVNNKTARTATANNKTARTATANNKTARTATANNKTARIATANNETARMATANNIKTKKQNPNKQQQREAPTQHSTQLSARKPRTIIPSWEDAKNAVFSSSTSSDASYNDSTDPSSPSSTHSDSLWAAPAPIPTTPTPTPGPYLIQT